VKEFSFILMAGGLGRRMGGASKQFRSLAGRPLWRWSLDTALSLRDSGVAEIVLTVPPALCHEVEDELRKSSLGDVVVAPGGPERSDSVLNGLKAARSDYVLVHDAARPFVTRRLCENLMAAVTETCGCIPVLPVGEALKKTTGKGNLEAMDRDGVYTTQTPQAFPRVPLLELIGAAQGMSKTFKDEAEAWLAAGYPLAHLDGERLNFKITWPEDMRIASALSRGRERRVGIGYDVHSLVPGRPLVLAGVKLDSSLGLLGHSDADVVAHTVADALLGGAGLPDIGNLFPASEARYENADSMELLRDVCALLAESGWSVVWVDLVIAAQVPRLNHFLPEMALNLSQIMDPGGPLRVSLKAKSGENVGSVGRAECILCHAAATLVRMEA
jgi:2-C-methyl-D-erythritol 4-phosphate cytidylyltransferase/2-C-methyl-D-erythritol 2,4-cyclodiphosphate synthase